MVLKTWKMPSKSKLQAIEVEGGLLIPKNMHSKISIMVYFLQSIRKIYVPRTFGKLYTCYLRFSKRRHNVPKRRLISNCGNPIEKHFEFLHHHFKSIMQNGWSIFKTYNGLIDMSFESQVMLWDYTPTYPMK